MKRKKNVAKSESAFEKLSRMPANKKRRLFVKSAVSLGVMGVAAGAISGYVVQIHDTSCPICRRLKSRSIAVLENQSHIEYRLADIVTAKGKALQDKYGVQKTTLLLFDAKGKHVDTVYGLQTTEELESLFSRRFPPA